VSLLLITATSENLQPVATAEETVILVFRQIVYSKHQGSIVYLQSCFGSTVKIVLFEQLAFSLNYTI